MAVITPTSADLRIGETSNIAIVTAGEALVAFRLVYSDSTDSNLYKYANATTEAEATVIGMTVTAAAINKPVAILLTGSRVESSSAIWTQGNTYHADGGDGLMTDAADSALNEWVTVIGTAETDSIFLLDIAARGWQAV
jgi:hypothetical protein